MANVLVRATEGGVPVEMIARFGGGADIWEDVTDENGAFSFDGVPRTSYSLEGIGRYYRDYLKLMAHIDEVLPGRVHRVFYEDTVADTETVVRNMLEYCGLEYEVECLRFFESDRPVRTASSEQVRQPIYQEGTEQWQHFEEWLGPLKDALGVTLIEYPAVPKS